MSYIPPVSKEKLLESVNRFKIFILIAMLVFVFIIFSMFICANFWTGNLIWSLGSFITLVSVVTNRYFDIKKTANSNNQLIDLVNIPQPEKNIISTWLSIEKFVSYLWILGTILVFISRWVKL